MTSSWVFLIHTCSCVHLIVQNSGEHLPYTLQILIRSVLYATFVLYGILCVRWITNQTRLVRCVPNLIEIRPLISENEPCRWTDWHDLPCVLRHLKRMQNIKWKNSTKLSVSLRSMSPIGRLCRHIVIDGFCFFVKRSPLSPLPTFESTNNRRYLRHTFRDLRIVRHWLWKLSMCEMWRIKRSGRKFTDVLEEYVGYIRAA